MAARTAISDGSGTRTDWQHDAADIPTAPCRSSITAVSPRTCSRAGSWSRSRSVMTATLVEKQASRRDPGRHPGSMQILPNGNVFVGGAASRFSRSSSRDGACSSMRSPQRSVLPRVPLAVEGQPVAAPIALRPRTETSDGLRQLEWATEVDSEVLTGPGTEELVPVVSVPARVSRPQ